MIFNPKITRGEYWILNSVVEAAIPICWLDWDNIEEVLNKSSHGMDRNQLKQTLLEMFSLGLIEAHISGDFNEIAIITPEKIDVALDERQHPRCLYYHLTPKGGIYWEAFALPNWKYYIYEAHKNQDDNGFENGEIIGSNKDVIQNYFNSLCVDTIDLKNDSVSWHVFQPWQATYWKELSIGHSVQFKSREIRNQYHAKTPTQIDKAFYDRLWCEWR